MRITVAIQKGVDPNKAEAQVRAASEGREIKSLQILKVLGVLIIEYSDKTTFEEAKERLASCDVIMANTICEDCEIHLIQ